jgi:two-component system cell cycle sensor histidine kinase/response regulator CckA
MLRDSMTNDEDSRSPAPPEGEPRDGAGGLAPGPAPRPPGAEDILRLMAERDRAAREAQDVSAAPHGRATWRMFLLAVLGGAVAGAALGGAFLLLSMSGLEGPPLAGATVAIALMIGVVIAAALSLIARARPQAGRTPARLAGADMLSALGLAEKILDADPDARLLTRRDGVVVFANRAYGQLAAEAGVAGSSGLPPRIDRLFAQQGSEATKIFRLCRAAKSGSLAEEILIQRIGLAGGGRRRRFEASVRPIEGSGDHVAWRLRELPAEDEDFDALAAAFADFPRPVFALEKSGAIAWTNAAMRARLGAARGALSRLDDIVLGETGELVRKLWQVDQAPAAAKIRVDGGDGDARFIAFRRGGVGEGFVAVELDIAPERIESEESPLAGELAEAPFAVAIIEGEFASDARVIEANRAFFDAFSGVRKNTPLARVFGAATLADLDEDVRRKASAGRAIEASLKEGKGAFALYARPMKRKRGAYGARRTLVYALDSADRRRAEEESRRDQKLKAIGKLTGEIAHDFNNLLQVVLGNCERLLLRHPVGDPDYADLLLVRGPALRASNLIKQLLAFSRTQTLKREVLSITELLRDWGHFLNSVAGERTRVDYVNGRGLPPIKVDKNQLENALMNLAVNALDAMGGQAGRITIKTSLVAAAEIAAAGPKGLAPADHLLIEFADTGPGVPEDIRDRIFDPFFTTKETGKGTGLGLATVYGIITQMDGAITVGDAPGGGALFRIYLPAFDGEAESAAAESPRGPVDLTGAGRILVVEDEDAVRTFVLRALEDCGYEVTIAADAEEALEKIAADRIGFDLILSDVMMPGMDGPTLIARARSEHALAARVIFMSAYAESAVREQIDSLASVGYIQKPFTLKGLAAKVKETLARPESAAA